MSVKIIPLEFDEDFIFENFSTASTINESLLYLKIAIEKLLKKKLSLYTLPYIRLVIIYSKKYGLSSEQEKILIFLSDIDKYYHKIEETLYYYILFHLRSFLEELVTNKNLLPDSFYKVTSISNSVSFPEVEKREQYLKVYLISVLKPNNEKKYYRLFCRTSYGLGITIILFSLWENIVELLYHGQILGFYYLKPGEKEYIYICDSNSLLILSPDIILDVSDIKNCVNNFNDYKIARLCYTKSSSAKQIVGNIVNKMLDELLIDNVIPDDNYIKELISSFKFNLALAKVLPFSIIEEVKNHLRVILKSGLIEKIKSSGKFSVEPTYISTDFGITGRIDVLCHDTNEIIELKTGKPKDYGVWENDKSQTVLYSLMVQNKRENPNDKITVFYSRDEIQPFRNIDIVYPKEFYNSINRRNEIIGFDRKFVNLNPELLYQILDDITKCTSYIYSDSIQKIKSTLENLKNIEYKELIENYISVFVSFCERERYFQKMEFSSLWNKSEHQKRDEFKIIGPMKYLSSDEATSTIEFLVDNNESKFREGDICIIYDKNEHISSQQIFKGTIKSISRNKVVIALKNKGSIQFLKEQKLWFLEADYLDVNMRKNIWAVFDFALLEKRKQKLILGIEKPNYLNRYSPKLSDKLTDRQREAIYKSLNAEDYHLIQGPPGTGKTTLLAYLLKELINIEGERVLVTAFTNRAVDEIINKFIFETDLKDYIVRLGNDISTEYPEFSLSNLIKDVPDEKIPDFISNKKIFFSTIATASYNEIFQMLDFTTTIVDESSQVIEPETLSVIIKSKKFILIGDERQLPAVVLQTNNEGDIKEIVTDVKVLNEIGINRLDSSLFERLVCIGKKNNWNSYTLLDTQFRMNEKILEFSNKNFYENLLISGSNAIDIKLEIENDFISINSNPVEFFDIHGFGERKKNKLEADALISVLLKYYNYNKEKNLGLSFGVIAPFRAQVSYIYHELLINGIEDIKVDTVERFQGGEKDIIFISFSIYHHSQISQIQSLQEYNNLLIDRKLNVALTRAKRKLVMFGNANLLSTNPIFNKLISFCKEKRVYHSYKSK